MDINPAYLPNKPYKYIIMKADDLINYTAVSQLLTNTRDNIRKNKIPRKNQEQIKELHLLIDYWINKNK